MKPGELIRHAILNAGVALSQTIYAEDIYQGFDHINMMMAQWNRRNWLIYRDRDVFLTSNGNLSYWIGPGGDFNFPRPDSVKSAFVRYITQITGASYGDGLADFAIGESNVGLEQVGADWPLQILQSREDYNKIRTKNIYGGPSALYYDPMIPMGRVFFYPVPAAGLYELHMTVMEQLVAFDDLSTDISLPGEYQEALLYNLGVRLRIARQMPPDARLDGLARASLGTIRSANAQIPRAEMPYGVMPRRPRYNIYNDRGA